MNTRKKYTVCRAGAAVRLHGYAPARVLRVAFDDGGVCMAECKITARGPDWKRGNIGPHGYRPGDIVCVRAFLAVPRDIIRVSRKYTGRIIWHPFSIKTGE